MDEFDFQKQIREEFALKKRAREILGVDEDASPDELKAAWRRACRSHHPDHNPQDAGASRRFVQLRSAYRLLAYGEPCDLIGPEPEERGGLPCGDSKYRTDNAWGMFLWWRERFF